MFKKRLITACITTALCAIMLTSCGGGNTVTETESKPPLPNGKITERGKRNNDFANNGENGIEEGIDNVKNGIERGMDNMKDNAEDATHGTARQDGHDNDTEAETDMPQREHRTPVPKGK